jgi:hypothetical protein
MFSKSSEVKHLYHRYFQIAFSILFDHHLYLVLSFVIIIALLLYYDGLNDSHC